MHENKVILTLLDAVIPWVIAALCLGALLGVLAGISLGPCQ